MARVFDWQQRLNKPISSCVHQYENEKLRWFVILFSARFFRHVFFFAWFIGLSWSKLNSKWDLNYVITKLVGCTVSHFIQIAPWKEVELIESLNRIYWILQNIGNGLCFFSFIEHRIEICRTKFIQKSICLYFLLNSTMTCVPLTAVIETPMITT